MSETVKHESLAAALAAFQMELPTIKKGNQAKVETKSGGEYKYQYADLADISPEVLPLLGKHGLSWSTQPNLLDDSMVLHYELKHESGESIEGLYPLPNPSTPPQAMGSAITYARRYALCAVTGVAPGGDDDDAQQAQSAPPAARTRRSAPAPKVKPVDPASVDWAAQIIDAGTVDELRVVHQLVEDQGELGRVFNPEHADHVRALVRFFELPEPSPDVTVGQVIGAVKRTLEQRAKAAPTPPVEEPVAEEAEASPEDAPMALGDPVTEWAAATPGEAH